MTGAKEENPTITGLLSTITGVGALKAGSIFFATLASVIVARHLGPQYYGQVTLVLAILTLLSIPSNNAMAPLLVREVARLDQSRDPVLLFGFLGWSWKLSIIVVSTTTLPLLAWSIYAFQSDEPAQGMLLLVAAPLVLVWALGSRVSNVLLGLKKTVLSQTFDWLVSPGLYLLFILGLWILNLLNPISVIASSVVSVALSVVAGYFALHTILPIAKKPPFRDSRNWTASWRHFLLLQLLSTLNTRAPILMLGIFSNTSDVGLYRVAENVAVLVALPLMIINTVIGPMISRLHASGDMDKLMRIAKGSARLALAVTLPITISIVWFDTTLIDIVFGTEYRGATSALALLLVSQVINVACGSVGLILSMSGLEKHGLKAWIAALIFNLLLCILLIPKFGPTGAAAAAATSTLVWNFFLLTIIRKSLGINVSAV